MKRLGLIIFLLVAGPLCANDYYSVETIPPPPGVSPQCGGLDFLPDGRLVAVFDHGEVCIYTPATRTWKKFAEGLHTPLGVLAVSDREILVCQRPELTRLVDTTGSGVADEYQCVSDAWGISGNYHEFAYGPIRDPEGSLFVALGNGSPDGVARYEVRGEFNDLGRKFGAQTMFSVVPYRGWIARIGSAGELIPIAQGFRQPNGIVFDPQGRLFATDNQGDWVGTSKLHYVVEGGFYGHPSGLAWSGHLLTDRWPDIWKDLFKAGTAVPSVEALDRLRHEGSILFPHAILANSPGEPVFDKTGGKFGPFAGQMFVTEFNIGRILRVMMEEVAGELQGSVTTFYDGSPLRAGNIRLAFAPDGSLWVGQNERHLGWPAGEGIQRIRWNGALPMEVSAMHLSSTGFEFTFTKPVDPSSATPSVFSGQRYYYLYQADYGSPRVDIHPVSPSGVRVSADGLRVSVDLAALHAGYIYQFNLKGLKAADGTPLLNTLIAYTANRLQDGSSRPIPRPAPTGESNGSGKDKD